MDIRLALAESEKLKAVKFVSLLFVYQLGT